MKRSGSEATDSDSSDLVCFLYVSTSTRECSEQELETMLDRSRARNSELGITGLLIYCQEHFLQVLEGSKTAVEQTYERITEDSRHKKLKILVNEPVEKRFFTDWSMAYKRVFDPNSVEAASVQKILTTEENGPVMTVKKMFEIFQEYLD